MAVDEVTKNLPNKVIMSNSPNPIYVQQITSMELEAFNAIYDHEHGTEELLYDLNAFMQKFIDYSKLAKAKKSGLQNKLMLE